MAYEPQVKLNEVSLVEDYGVHLYAHSASSNTVVHFPLAVPSLFLKFIHNDFVCSFILSISLRMFH